jgi:pilus assembly protein CpaF
VSADEIWPAAAPAFGGGAALPGLGQRGTGAGQQQIDYSLVRLLQAQVADRLTVVRQQRLVSGQPELNAPDERQLTLTLIREAVAAHIQARVDGGLELPDASLDAHLAQAVEAAIFGAGALQPLLDDPAVENIDINGTQVWVTYADERGKVLADPVVGSDEELIDLVSTLAAYQGLNARPFTPASPELDLRLGDGSRLSAVMTASPRPVVSIRRNRFPQMFLATIPAAVQPGHGRRTRARTTPLAGAGGAGEVAQTLLELGTVDEQLAAFLQAAVRGRCNIVVAGATDSGKTTLLRALIHCVPASERLVTVERALELGLGRHPQLHPDVVELEEVLPSADGGGGVSIGQLVRRSRRMNPSRVIVGEVLGPEVVEMLSAMSQGNDGSLSTLHARDAGDVFNRLATYAAQHEHLDFTVTHALIGASVDLVVFIRKNPRRGGRRMVMEVLEVTGSSDGRVTRSHIFTEGPDGRARREVEIPLLRAALLAEHGYDDLAWDPYERPGDAHRLGPGWDGYGSSAGPGPWPPAPDSGPWPR